MWKTAGNRYYNDACPARQTAYSTWYKRYKKWHKTWYDKGRDRGVTTPPKKHVCYNLNDNFFNSGIWIVKSIVIGQVLIAIVCNCLKNVEFRILKAAILIHYPIRPICTTFVMALGQKKNNPFSILNRS